MSYSQPEYQPPPAYGSVPVPELPAGQVPPAAYIGDIGVSGTHVYLPGGVFAIKGAQWQLQDTTYAVEKTSQLGIILAAVGFLVLCFFSLFFLLLKEQQVSGFVTVTVSGPGYQHTTTIAAQGPGTGLYVNQLVNWARGLSL